MNREVIGSRLRAARASLKKNNLDCLVATRPANVSYLTGFTGDDSWVLLTERNAYLLTDSRYAEQAHGECHCCRIIQRTGTLAAEVARLSKKLKSVQSIAVERCTSLADFASLRKKTNTKVRQAPDIVEPLRVIKHNSEITAIKRAADIANLALRQAFRSTRIGITENELAGRADFEARRLGARNSFETIVAFGANASRPHHRPGRKKLKKNDAVLIDFGLRHKSYCCDLTRCFTVGRCGSLYEKAYRTVQEAQRAAIKTIRDGVEIQEVDSAARAIISRYGLPVYGHGTGHGLGLEVHEEPIISKERKGKLRAGMVLTIEPGVYIPGKLGVRIEDDVLVTRTGCRILTTGCNEAGPPLRLPAR